MAKCIEYEQMNYTLIATFNSFLFRFDRPPVLDEQPIKLENGSDMKVGDGFIELYGDHTSAMFRGLHLSEGFLVYKGLFANLEGRAVLFHYHHPGHEIESTLFYGFMINEAKPDEFVFSTPARAARAVETKYVVRSDRSGPVRTVK